MEIVQASSPRPDRVRRNPRPRSVTACPWRAREAVSNCLTMTSGTRSSDHCFVFHYTPTHGSWLNQVELWFATVSRRVLRHGGFPTLDELVVAIGRFIEQWNESEARPFRWTYQGLPLPKDDPAMSHRSLGTDPFHREHPRHGRDRPCADAAFGYAILGLYQNFRGVALVVHPGRQSK